ATTMWDPDGAGPMQPVLVVGGEFTIAGTAVARGIAAYDPVTGAWSALGSGIDIRVLALTSLPNGDLVAGGPFTTAGGVSASNIARWSGTSWSALGSGMNNYVYALTTLPNGDVVAGGQFTTAGGVSANYIARWNGTSWSALGSGMNGFVYALTTLPNGDLLAGGAFTTAGGVSANRVARWNGTSWSPLGSGISAVPASVLAMAVLPNGDVVAGGYFTTAGGAGGNYIARWNGTNWSALGSGMNNQVLALTTLPNGYLVAGGVFTVVNGAISMCLARLTTTCPATAVSYGAGCTGSGGPNVLAATSLPWIGSTFRSAATGMPSSALALGVFGFSTITTPMPSILPQGVAGCTLHVSTDLLELYVPAAGIMQTQLAIPNTVAIVGVVLHQQVVPIELSGTGSITALTGTNALTLTIGSF
ncbi:MAG TPA: hypothetical protein VF384_13525, partial [Planctomycetota bacterium]